MGEESFTVCPVMEYNRSAYTKAKSESLVKHAKAKADRTCVNCMIRFQIWETRKL